MLQLKNWVLSAPDRADRLLGYDGENLARTLAVFVDEPAQWQYKFELRFSDGKVNILDATLHENVVSSQLQESHLSAAGPCELQVRGLSGGREIKSNVLGLMLAQSIRAGEAFSAPSEFQQLEQNLSNIKEQAVAAAGQAQFHAENAQDCAERAETAAEKAQQFSQNTPKIQNGTWWVYHPASGQYEDSGQKVQGKKGETGAQGQTGATGEKGEPGEKGDRGDRGEQGEKGDKGDRGEPGAKGDKGDPGEKGERGETGLPGQKGDTGERGERGERGHDFVILGSYATKEVLQQSVPSPKVGEAYAVGTERPYDIYVYDGVTSDWTNYGKLQGAKGDKGDRGEPGEKGEKGEPGAKGDKGERGKPGEKGEKGEPGAKGDKGNPGEQGIKGEKGDPGEPGAKGDKGNPGEQGIKGDKGDPGDPGAKGDKGEPGISGAPGKSAYQAALDGGFVGEEMIFNAALGVVKDKITDPKSAEDGQVLTYRMGEWRAEAIPISGVSSFKGRIGAITPQAGDYTATQVGAIPKVNGTQGQFLGFTAQNVIGAVKSPSGRRCARFVVGASAAGWTVADVDYLCDGTDDQAEINAAIQSLPNTGGEIVILDGTYNITADININKVNIKLRGNGKATLLKAIKDSVKSILDVKKDCCTISHLVCIKEQTLNTNCNGITCVGNNHTIIGNMCSHVKSGIVYSGENITIRNNICSNNTGNGILGVGEGCSITDNICVRNTSDAIWITGKGNNTLANNICIHNVSGISIVNASNNNSITGNVCAFNRGCGIFCSSNNNIVTGNICNDNIKGIECEGNNNAITGNTCIRDAGLSSNYTSSEYTINIISSSKNNLVTGNNCMGKAPTNRGANNTVANNKY